MLKKVDIFLDSKPYMRIIHLNALSTLVITYKTLGSNLKFRKLAGMYGIFQINFKIHLATLRMATLVTVYEDCSGLVEIKHFGTITGMVPSEALTFLLTKPLVDEVSQLLRPAQEGDIPNSYFVHFCSLGISSTG